MGVFFQHLPEEYQETGFGTRSRRTSLCGGMLAQQGVLAAGADKLDTCCEVFCRSAFSCKSLRTLLRHMVLLRPKLSGYFMEKSHPHFCSFFSGTILMLQE